MAIIEIARGLNTRRYEPVGDYIQLDYVKPEKVGEIHLPGNAKIQLQYVESVVLAVGPKCTQVAVGNKLLLATAAMLVIPAGSGGLTVTLTKEDKVLAVVK